VVAFEQRLQRVAPVSVTLEAMLASFRDVLRRAAMFSEHHVQREPLSVRERMSIVLERARPDHFTAFTELFKPEEGKAGVVVTLLAILELLRQHLIELVQNEDSAPIYVKLAA